MDELQPYEVRLKKHFRTDEFRTEAMRFDEQGYYCKYPASSIQGKRYWLEQTKRCIHGYHAGHDWIPGYFYFYLNFSPIMKSKVVGDATSSGARQAIQVKGFPDFWDGDYEFFQYINECEKFGMNADVLKRRRAGYSLKCAAMLNRNYFFYPNSKNYAVAYESEFLTKDGIITKAWTGMDFVDQNTAWAKHRHKKDTAMHRRASRVVNVGGVKVEKGFMSEIIGVSLKDDPDKIRGKIAKLIVFEEKGKFPGLMKAWSVAFHSTRQDDDVFGMMLSIGTGGESGSDFLAAEKFFKRPRAYHIMPVANKWSKHGGECSMFVPGYMNMQGFMDSDGNSDIEGAKGALEKKVAFLEKQADDPQEIIKFKAEVALTPEDAMLRIGGTIFPVDELKSHQGYVETNDKKFKNAEYIGDISLEGKEWKWSVNNRLKPIREFPLLDEKHQAGCNVIYQMPVKNADGVIPFGVYIGGIDSYDHDESNTTSLGSLFIMNKLTGEIVAEYTGRPKFADMFYEGCRKLLHFFNAQANYENYNKGILTYFEHHKCDYLLAETPKILSDVIKDSKVNRKKGTHPTREVKRYSRELIKKWLLSPHPSGDGRLMLNTIASIPLLEELIFWNPEDNFDRVDALGYLMILREERYTHNPEINKKIRTASNDIQDMFDNYLKQV